jgi:replicative DNA helicase
MSQEVNNIASISKAEQKEQEAENKTSETNQSEQEDKAEKGKDNIKQNPYNIDAEQIILGALLNNNETLNKVADFLLPKHFYEPLHQRIFEAIMSYTDKGIRADIITLKNKFEADEAMQELGGVNSYLGTLSALATGLVGIRDYAQIVYNLYISRSLIEIAEETLESSYSSTGHENAAEQIERPENKLFTLASEGDVESNFTAISKSVKNALEIADLASKSDSSQTGIPSKLSDLDNLLGGFNRSDLLILAARPSMGKTALALNFTMNAAESLKERHDRDMKKWRKDREDNPALEQPKIGSIGLISLEMSAEQLANRLLSIKTGINASDIRRGKLSKSEHNDEFAKLIRAAGEIDSLPIFIDDTPALSISAIRTKARRLKRKNNLSFLIIDYLQLIRGVGKKSQENRVQEISEISMGLKAIAKELDIPVIALSQLSRQVEQRADKRPQLSDLRESGSIEQDADIVMFIYREAYYKEREKPSEAELDAMTKWQEDMAKIDNVSEVIVAKNRNGPINNVRLFFDKNTTKFSNYAEGYNEE